MEWEISPDFRKPKTAEMTECLSLEQQLEFGYTVMANP